MITHTKTDNSMPNRVIILGGSGFVGCAAAQWLINKSVEVLSISSQELDLLKHDSTQKLIDILNPSDTLILVSAKAPVKNAEMLEQNIRMARVVCDAIQNQPINHLLYVSSDAVYGDFDRPINEQSHACPGSLHGVMHLARELMLSEAAEGIPFGIVRPTLVYGPNDPHNGYGPNMFRRRLASGQSIFLFGKGEEKRDHIYVDDVGEIIGRMAFSRSKGILNAVTGNVLPFHDIAKLVISNFQTEMAIDFRPRSGPMPHNGYRAFDASAITKAFPDFLFTEIFDGLRKCYEMDPAIN